MMSKQGWYDKYRVTRTDGRDRNQTDKHYQCDYFVLDISHDPLAIPALITYAKATAHKNPMLAADLLSFVSDSPLFFEEVK